MKALVVGGFEPSGHDSLSEALVQTGHALGHDVHDWRWRERVDCADHPLFHLHRIGVATDEPEIAILLDEPHLALTLGEDLGGLLPLDRVDVAISTHPWSTAVCLRDAALLPPDERPPLVDCHGEFTPFPLPFLAVDAVDAFVGGIVAAPGKPSLRRRVWRTGIPVRDSFVPQDRESVARDTITVNPGHESWAGVQLAPALNDLLDAFEPDRVAVIGSRLSGEAWAQQLPDRVDALELVATESDIAAALRRSACILTKASGSAVAEALASGCVPVCPATGVFWEDEARAWLASLGAAIPYDGECDLSEAVTAGPTRMARTLGLTCKHAAKAIWSIVDPTSPLGYVSEPPAARSAAISHLRERLESAHALPETTATLGKMLDAWR